MLTVTIDQSEGISGADIPEQAVKKMRTGSAALSLPSPACFSHFLLLNDFPPPSRSLEQARRPKKVVVIRTLLPSSLPRWPKAGFKMAFTAMGRRNSWVSDKTGRKKCKNTQTVLLDGCYLLFSDCLQEEKNLFISWNRAGKKAEVLKKVTTDVFAWMIKQMLNSAFVWCEELCRSRTLLSPSAIIFLSICIILHITSASSRE